MAEKVTVGTRQMVLAQDTEGNVFKVFVDAIPPAAVVEHDEKALVLIQDPRINTVYKAFLDDLPKLAELDPELLVTLDWKDKWKDYTGQTPPWKDYTGQTPPWKDFWRDSGAVVEQVAETPSLESYLEEQPDLKFVPIKEFG